MEYNTRQYLKLSNVCSKFTQQQKEPLTCLFVTEVVKGVADGVGIEEMQRVLNKVGCDIIVVRITGEVISEHHVPDTGPCEHGWSHHTGQVRHFI